MSPNSAVSKERTQYLNKHRTMSQVRSFFSYIFEISSELVKYVWICFPNCVSLKFYTSIKMDRIDDSTITKILSFFKS